MSPLNEKSLAERVRLWSPSGLPTVGQATELAHREVFHQSPRGPLVVETFQPKLMYHFSQSSTDWSLVGHLLVTRAEDVTYSH